MSRESKQKRKLNRELKQIAKNWPPPWTPFQKIPLSQLSGNVQLTEEEVKKFYGNSQYFMNSRYQVLATPMQIDFFGNILEGVKLSIKSNDKGTYHDWRDFQRIKNEICGADAEGVELYPAESRLVDTSNQYFMYVVKPPFKFPFGFQERMVSEYKDEIAFGQPRQRPFPDDIKPNDLKQVSDVDLITFAREKHL